jgi:hypothetical protein
MLWTSAWGDVLDGEALPANDLTQPPPCAIKALLIETG